MNLLYFTESYPFGLGEKWKTNELEQLTKSFDNIHVIPRHYGGNKKMVSKIPNVKYHKPILINRNPSRWYYSFLRVATSKHVFYFMTELFSEFSFSVFRLKQWLGSSHMQIILLKNKTIKELLINTNKQTIAYFFWGRGTAEIIPLIKNNNVKSYVRLHGYDLYLDRHQTKYIPFQKKIFKFSHKLLLISRHGLDYVINKLSQEQHKLCYSPLGTPGFKNAIPSNDRVLRIVSCSSLIPLKRVTLIAKSISDVSQFEIEWTHIGDGEEKNKLLEISASFNDNIKFSLTGWVTSDNVKEYFENKMVDLFINLSTSEGVPVSIMEAMSSGVPVMATNVGGVSEIVNSSNGILLNHEISENEVANQIEQFYHLPDQIKLNLRQNAILTFKEKYDAFKNANNLIKILQMNE